MKNPCHLLLILILSLTGLPATAQDQWLMEQTRAMLPDSLQNKYPAAITYETAYLPYLAPNGFIHFPAAFLSTSPSVEEITFFFLRAIPGMKDNKRSEHGELFHHMMGQCLLANIEKNRMKNVPAGAQKKDLLSQYLDQNTELKTLAAVSDKCLHPKGQDRIPGEDSLLWRTCHQLWEEDEYPLAIRIAFYQYEFLHNDSTAKYLLVEGMRRMILRFPGSAYKGFCGEGARAVLRTGSIFRDLRLLEPDTSRFRKIALRWNMMSGAPILETYGEAMEFFLRENRRVELPEMHLCAALWYLKNTMRKDSCLTLYLSQKKILHRDYAFALLHNELMSSLMGNTRNINYLFPLEKYTRDGESLLRSDSVNPSFNTTNSFMRYFKGEYIFLEEYKKYNSIKYARINYFRRLCAGNQMDKVSEHEHCTGFTLQQVETDTSLWRKRNPFHIDPSFWEWMRSEKIRSLTFIDPYMWERPSEALSKIWFYVPVAYPLLLPRYVMELRDGSPAYAFGVQSVRMDLQSSAPISVSTETHWKKIRQTYYDNLLFYSKNELDGQHSRNLGFSGHKNYVHTEPLPMIHNGHFKINYSRTLAKHFRAEIGLGMISKSGDFNYSWQDSADIKQTEHFNYLSEGLSWTAGLYFNSYSAGVPSPAGLYYGFEVDRVHTTYAETPDSTGESFSYDYRHVGLIFAGGGNVLIGRNLILDLGIRTGLQWSTVKPLHSASAYRVPLRGYPDPYVWDSTNAFRYNSSTDDVGGTGNNSFATMQLLTFNWIFYPVIRLGVLF